MIFLTNERYYEIRVVHKITKINKPGLGFNQPKIILKTKLYDFLMMVKNIFEA